jgi:hypothetical protein
MRSDARGEERLGPVETWITYQEQVQAQEKADGEYLDGVPKAKKPLSREGQGYSTHTARF